MRRLFGSKTPPAPRSTAGDNGALERRYDDGSAGYYPPEPIDPAYLRAAASGSVSRSELEPPLRFAARPSRHIVQESAAHHPQTFQRLFFTAGHDQVVRGHVPLSPAEAMATRRVADMRSRFVRTRPRPVPASGEAPLGHVGAELAPPGGPAMLPVQSYQPEVRRVPRASWNGGPTR